MFRELRRKKQKLSDERSIEILQRQTAGVLAVSGDEGYPYAVPLSYVYADGKIFFHCALTGHKLDAISRNEKVSFCVIDKNQIVPEEYTTYFRSVIVFGKAGVIRDESRKRQALALLAAKYSPEQTEGREEEAAKEFEHLHMVEIDIEYLSGKEAIELAAAKRQEQQK